MKLLSKYSPVIYLAVFVLMVITCLSLISEESSIHGLPDEVDFNVHVRPILAQNCYTCHGPDSSSRKADLRLDIYDGATSKLETGLVAIDPHNPSNSAMMSRIESDDPDYRMPPPEAKKILSAYDIALIRKWIAQGAEWKKHWAFIKPTLDVPSKLNSSSPSNVIDYFIEKKLIESSLQNNPQATDNSLLRRIAYLLTGLPPTTNELEQFKDLSNDSKYEEMIDYYLSSPHFGERWARHWMDLVRYGEFMGHEFDYPINGAWIYRDYLIRAFNQDVPYDQFVLEHLAGDLIKEPRLHPELGYNESILGTAYVNLGEGKHSPVSIKEEEATKIDNIIDVTSKTFQALTVGCARCHDHKFDEIPTTDYYAMYGMFESARTSPMAAYQSFKNLDQIKEITTVKKDIKISLGKSWKKELSNIPINTIQQKIKYIHSLNSYSSTADDLGDSDLSVIGDFRTGTWDNWKVDGIAFGDSPIAAEPEINMSTGQVRGIPNENLVASSRVIAPGLSGALRSPNFIIEHDSIIVRAAGDSSTIRIIVDNFQLIQNPLYGSFSVLVDNREMTNYTLDVSMVKGHKAYVEFIPGYFKQHKYFLNPYNYIEIEYAIAANKNIDEALQQPSVDLDFSEGEIKESIDAWINQRSTILQNSIVSSLVQILPKEKLFIQSELVSRLEQLQSSLFQPLHFTGMAEGDAIFSPVFNRGDYKDLSEEVVPHQYLSAIDIELENFAQKGSGRLAWAEAVTHQENPLTSRVIVNRIWHHLFGRGIVETVDNFGLQGKLPSHPELFDYLALQFVKDGWSIKKMIRQILLTDTFKQSTGPSNQTNKVDPQNIYLSHFPIRRLEAEAIRDGMLAASGSLNDKMYGKPEPIHLTDYMTGRGRPRVSGPLDGNGRRSIYLEIRRNFLSPMMLAFDMPIPFSTFGKRNVTNVPAQSLILMNDPFVYEQAAKWAESIIQHSDDSDEDRIQHIYLRAFSRIPTTEEINTAKELLSTLSSNYKDTSEKQMEDIRLWSDFCHAIFNFKEFIYLM